MGTRSVSAIALNGKIVLSQTKQFDGYPSGLGIEIVEEIKSHWKKDSLISAMLRVKQVDGHANYKTQEEPKDLFDKPDFLDHIGLQGALEKLRENPDEIYRMDVNNILFGQDSLFCEWGYVVDLDRFVIEIFTGFNRDTPINSGWFSGEGHTNYDGTHFHPISKIAEFDLNQNLSELENQLTGAENSED